ncbi:MAG TPA: hypothetical protein VMS21_11240 [Methylomirabilota bacterium]|nr:hypothetical protein [Methylomirabilota bacterium]
MIDLARALGAAGNGGGEIEALLNHAVRAECVLCGMGLSGVDLIRTEWITDPSSDSGRKLERLRLGYCARYGCSSRYYVLRFARTPGVDWPDCWEQAAALPPVEAASDSESVPGGQQAPHRFIPVRMWRLAAQRPITVVVIAALALSVSFRTGCRIPGLTPAPRVFIVESAPEQPGPIGELR